jgi:UDP-GlcNAc3NAcA epimerase
VLDYLRKSTSGDVIILPLHPRTRLAASRFGVSLDGIHVTDPVGYLDMARLLDACSVVLTDSGGVQKEAYFHRKPCVTLRSETEWVETIECGWNRLWTVGEYRERREIQDYGQGDAANRMVDLLRARA